MDTEEKIIKIDTKVTPYTNQKHDNYVILANDKKVADFSMSIMHGCCGTSNITYVDAFRNISDSQKETIFEKIKEKSVSKYNARNIVYFDKEDGDINFMLSKYFESISSYRNPNTNNIVEIRSYTLTPEEYNKYDSDSELSDNYDITSERDDDVYHYDDEDDDY